MTPRLSRTEYLFGYKKEKYGNKLEDLARERIADANELLVKLMSRRKYYPDQQSKFQRWISERVNEVIDARNTWEKILEKEI